MNVSKENLVRVVEEISKKLENHADFENIKEEISNIVSDEALVSLNIEDVETVINPVTNIYYDNIILNKNNLENVTIFKDRITVNSLSMAILIIRGNSNLKLSDVEKITNSIQSSLCDGSNIIFSVVVKNGLKDDELELSVIAGK